ncbi:MAG: hypothetical protein JWN20_316 [Jatrophihabitantaceae bacterium]|nr:hypothetical protein [Jatrophihabitantaceae bacterium]
MQPLTLTFAVPLPSELVGPHSKFVVALLAPFGLMCAVSVAAVSDGLDAE